MSIIFAAAVIAHLLCVVLADPRLVERPPLGHFEHDYHTSFQEADEQRRRKAQASNDKCSSAIDPPVSPIDLRVSKAHASHGYDAVRISIVSTSLDPPAFVRRPMADSSAVEDEVLSWDTSAPFKYRWTAQFDTGTANARCVADPNGNSLIESYNYTWGGHAESPAPDSQCLFDCQSNEECTYFSQYYNQTTNECICELFRECDQCIDAMEMEDLMADDAPDMNDALLLDKFERTSR